MNKAAFQDEVEVKLSAKNENDISILVMIDVDNFKQVNDKLGHSHGDQVIIRTGEILKKVFNADTIIGRLGGDEFASYSEVKISDNETDEKEYRESREGMIAIAREQLVKLRTEFDREFKEEKSKCSISLSTGVYITDKYSGAKENLKLIYDKADKALYNSKRTGRLKTLNKKSISYYNNELDRYRSFHSNLYGDQRKNAERKRRECKKL